MKGVSQRFDIILVKKDEGGRRRVNRERERERERVGEVEKRYRGARRDFR
jgi:hypothetical protein